MISETLSWLIIGAPLMAGLSIIFLIRPWNSKLWKFSGYVGIFGVAVAFILSLIAIYSILEHSNPNFSAHTWFTIGEKGSSTSFEMTVGILLDPLSAIMTAIVSGVSILVQIYSLGYMRKDVDSLESPWSDYPRYFAYLSLFTSSMLGLVLAYNLLQMFVFWELVGLFSYLLIGFWYHRPAAAAAAKKAFIVTRIGDFGFMIGILYLFFNRFEFIERGLNPLEIPAISEMAPLLGPGVATWVALGLFAGAIGKSAQFPLHTWLPDAMEGPTPVSSLIHAATMVAAGVFLVARLFDLFAVSTTAMNTVALIGGFTAIFAALMGLVANDIKRVLAFSTVSQLGYMFLAIGVGAPGVAMFHLFNHAFFKCLLFLGAGSVHHSVHTFDMRYMGGIRKWMPVTYVTTLIASLSLAGIFPLAGFWSKDEVLSSAFSNTDSVGKIVFFLALAAAFLTAFYITRLMLLTFHGDFRGGVDSVPLEERIPEESDLHTHKHESPKVMTFPMGILAILAIFSGLVANSIMDLGFIEAHWFSHFLHEKAPAFNILIASISTFTALAGITYAINLYRKGISELTNPTILGVFSQKILSNRFYLDHLYEGLIVKRVLYKGLFNFSHLMDKWIVDGSVNCLGWLGRNSGKAIAQLQTGQAQVYGLGVSLGVVVILLFFQLQ
tara:strand:- start:2506 stop:4500 length:1995 start_codon:yes stop_codon:yes gene_type:complete